MKIDDVNIEIIKHLRDGRKSFKEIADDLSITENTVRSRVAKMTEEGVLDISGLVDPEKLPGHRMVIIGVKLENMDLVNKGREISTLKGVVSVSVVTGQYDLIMIVLLKEGFDILEFYTEEMSCIKGVRSVETFVVYKNYNMKLPYLL
ncbi:MAG: transcriptional regulator [Spirochaetae bacterium HGW-Spirochaetae-1]|jgi:Lrp/AsnC family transcriptional regulator for asnA, asnC and gidA|nr:MAG: transcriptional regulator [Spirochaetae bacterium HGW-Spirochaetae-1]